MIEERFLKDIAYIAKKTRPTHISTVTFASILPDVPPSLLEIWEQFGVASWDDGAFQTCGPDAFRTAIDAALDGRFASKDVTPFVVSAFGLVKAWHKRYGVFNLNFPLGTVVLTGAPEEIAKKEFGDVNFISRFPIGAKAFPHIEGFEAIRQKLGRLGINQLYGFVPAIVLGGQPRLDNAKIVVADVHLALLSQLQPFKICTIHHLDSETFLDHCIYRPREVLGGKGGFR